MIKTFLSAAALAALIVSPASAQHMGGGYEGSDQGLDSQETQLPATGVTGDPAETQIPAGQSASPDAQQPADQSAQPMDTTPDPAEQSGQPSETQLPADQSAQPMEQQDPAAGAQSEPADMQSRPTDTQEAVVPSATGQAGELNESEVMQVQDALNQQGFDPGPTDGLMGPQTSGALRRFQQAQGIEATGQADQQTLAALGVGAAEQAPQQPQEQQQPEQAPSQP